MGPRSLALDADPAELVIDALQAIGKRRITEEEVATLRDFVHRRGLTGKLKRRARRAPAWMAPHIDVILAKV